MGQKMSDKMRMLDFDAASWTKEIVRRFSENPTAKAVEYVEYLMCSAAGIVAEAMCFLSLPSDHRFHLCAGWMGGASEWAGPMCYSGHLSVSETRDMTGSWLELMPEAERFPDVTYWDRERAVRVRGTLNQFFFTSWTDDGAFDGPKFWSAAFLVPERQDG